MKKYLVMILSLDKYISKRALKLSQKPLWKSVIILFLLLMLCVIPVFIALLMGYDMKGPDTYLRDYSFVQSFTIACIISPLFETGLLYLLIYIVHKYICKSMTMQILIPSVIFGLLHIYSWFYMICGMYAGIIFCYGFCAYYYNRSFKVAFWCIALVHLLHNAISIISVFS
jgi:hypothetical protein